MLATKTNDAARGGTEEKLGCYRLWAKPKAPRKAVRSRPSHMPFGPYLLGVKR
jgi:hypothetical protein